MLILFALVVCANVPALAQMPSKPLMAEATREVAALAQSGTTAAPPVSQVQQRSWVARHPALTGALIGLGVGVTIGVATCKYPGDEGGSCAYHTYPGNARGLGGLTFGLVGAGVGAGVGALIGSLSR